MFFISLLLSARTSAISFFRTVLMPLRVRGEHCGDTRLVTEKTDSLPRFEHFRILISHSIFHAIANCLASGISVLSRSPQLDEVLVKR
jgi:hypothetical protein